VRRRSWLLSKALDSRPLDQALELARKAEMFVSGAHPELIARISRNQLIRAESKGPQLSRRTPDRELKSALAWRFRLINVSVSWNA
jgi:hypothetical protein